VLDALSEEMPLELAVDVVARMLRTAIHNRRSATISRNLHRSLHLSTAAERAEVHPLLPMLVHWSHPHSTRADHQEALPSAMNQLYLAWSYAAQLEALGSHIGRVDAYPAGSQQ
jgi:hypothetical protein